LRGPGELHGRSQSGLTDLGMDALKNIKMVEAARTEAQKIVAKDPSLSEYPLILEKIAGMQIHFE
jgi:RecG-like helicase